MGGGCQRRGAREECRVRTERRGLVPLLPGCRDGERPGNISAAPPAHTAPWQAGRVRGFTPSCPATPAGGKKAIS